MNPVFNFAPLWKAMRRGEIDAFQAFAMCPEWVSPERFRRQHANYQRRMSDSFRFALNAAMERSTARAIIDDFHDRYAILAPDA